jgi:hypothetical protein
MCTGLLQTTIITFYVFVYATEANVSYLCWIMLIASTTQYPGFLSVFSNVLDALQQYHKSQTARFLSSTIVQRVIEMGFVYGGRVYGTLHPEIGGIMGIAIGSAIGNYLSQFIAMVFASYFFANVMKSYGVRPRDCFRVQFTWEEVKPAVYYALKTCLPGLIGGALAQFNFLLYVQYVPQYTSILVLSYVGNSITDTMDWFGVPGIGSLVSESYMNNKKKLTQYYVGQLMRFQVLLHGFFVPLFFTVTLVMPIAWVALNMENYAPATVFLLPHLIKVVVTKYFGIPGQVLYGGNRPNYGMITGVIGSFLNTGLLYLYLAVWQLPKTYGLQMTAIVMELGMLPLDLFWAILAYTFVHKTMLPMKVPLKQMFYGFVVPSLISLVLLVSVKFLVFDTIYRSSNFFVAVIPAVVLMASILLFIYFPLTGYLGGWDATNLEEFRKTSTMAGPSKFIVVPVYKLIRVLTAKSKYHGKFAMPTEGVIQEAADLLKIKRENREKMRTEMAQEH